MLFLRFLDRKELEIKCLEFFEKLVHWTFMFSLRGVTGAWWLNPFVPNAPFLYTLKTSENRKVFWCFQGVEKGCKPDDYVIIKRRIKREVLNFRINLWLNFFINAEKITVALPFKIFKTNSHTESDHFSFTSFNQRFSPTAFSNFLHWTFKA